MRAFILALAAASAIVLPAKAETVTVAVTAIVEHPALDAARDGVKAALAEAGYKEGENLKFHAVRPGRRCRHARHSGCLHGGFRSGRRTARQGYAEAGP